MRRKTRKLVIQLSSFLGILFLILFLNRPHSTKAFTWTTIRYKTSSTTLPQARGICPGLIGSAKPALIVSRVAADGDSKWLNSLADLYHLCVYNVDAPLNKESVNLQVPANRGHEAMAYLTFLIDNYAHIPESGAVFVHGSRWAWHNDSPEYDNAVLLAALNVSSALAPWGYHNMRCDWTASMCPSSSVSPPQGSLETSLTAMLEPWNARAVSDTALPHALATLFGGDEYATGNAGGNLLLGRTDSVRAHCCAQFVVARESIWQHSRDEYVALRQWLLDGSSHSSTPSNLQQSNAAPRDDRVAGRILSFVWHILFMQQGIARDPRSGVNHEIELEQLNIQACPRADECYCRLYGRCNLRGCTADSCYGQYQLPTNYALPKDWAETHS